MADDDTADTLAARILEAEHRIYPRAVRMVLEGRCARSKAAACGGEDAA